MSYGTKMEGPTDGTSMDDPVAEDDSANAAEGDATQATVDATHIAVKQRGGRRLWWLIAGVAVAALAVAAAVVVASDDSDDMGGTPVELSTATVKRTDLIVTKALDGTLGYGRADQLVFRSTTDGVIMVHGLKSGTVTDVVDEGTTVTAGSVLYQVNAEPVVALVGELPVYRAFHSRMDDGPDVEQLEQSLVDLGFDPDGDINVDEAFTTATANAIERLQESIGAKETGRLQFGDLLFIPSATYVADVLVEIGDAVSPGVPIVASSRPISGTVTGIAEGGSVIDQGGTLLTIDNQPVVLLLGDAPVTRSMSGGDEGDDVAQLQQALIDLGYGTDLVGTDLDVDGTFGTSTTDAVIAWQLSIGAIPDGVVNVGDVTFSPEPLRVGETLVAVGDPIQSGTPIMTTSVAETVVTVQLSTDDQDLVSVGDAVIVELPNGSEEPGVVTDIGTVVLASQQGQTYFEMTVTLDDPASAQGLDQAPVDVIVVSDRADEVLVVPVTALLALAEGGYAVEAVTDNGATTLIGVSPGLFADGFVEVTAQGLEAGMEVVVP